MTYLAALDDFKEGQLIICGVFNIPLDPLMDTHTGRFSPKISDVRRLKKRLASLLILDSWRVLHPDSRDYTYVHLGGPRLPQPHW